MWPLQQHHQHVVLAASMAFRTTACNFNFRTWLPCSSTVHSFIRLCDCKCGSGCGFAVAGLGGAGGARVGWDPFIWFISALDGPNLSVSKSQAKTCWKYQANPMKELAYWSSFLETIQVLKLGNRTTNWSYDTVVIAFILITDNALRLMISKL